jgi:hypothetical protein
MDIKPTTTEAAIIELAWCGRKNKKFFNKCKSLLSKRGLRCLKEYFKCKQDIGN